MTAPATITVSIKNKKKQNFMNEKTSDLFLGLGLTSVVFIYNPLSLMNTKNAIPIRVFIGIYFI